METRGKFSSISVREIDQAVSVRLLSGRSELPISGRSNQTQCCERLATAATLLRKELRCLKAQWRRDGPGNSLHASRNTASMIKDSFGYEKFRCHVSALVKKETNSSLKPILHGVGGHFCTLSVFCDKSFRKKYFYFESTWLWVKIHNK